MNKSLGQLSTNHSFQNLPKAGMGTIQPRTGDCRDIKLRAIGVRPRISHTYPARPIMLKCKIFISEAVAVDTVASSAIERGEISPCMLEGIANYITHASIIQLCTSLQWSDSQIIITKPPFPPILNHSCMLWNTQDVLQSTVIA